ncbi:Programmed cell death 6-interacting protein [Holothuria leucospilota]|uniref:Programmed cell death 6-interacting protein n=1 Tax=Holothuria leucospilota TaxID=206669 RepID=A0A9Q1BZA1_HOLLE|nr:Programmed cell death 6-interacting protein [Holothuria leucospilota]
MAMIAAPLKSTEAIDFEKPLKNFIKNTYADQFKSDEFDSQISELNKLRTNAVCRKLDRHVSSLDLLHRYYDQLVALEGKLPIAEGQVSINFKWYDVFDKGSVFAGSRKQTASNGNYEKNCVLYNIAAMHSQIGAIQSGEDDESLKKAAKSYQQAAGIFKYLTTNVYTGVQHVKTYDMHPDTLAALAALMLAQSQECFFDKTRQDKMKDAIIAKVASANSDLYAEALKLLQVPHVRDNVNKEWIPIVAGKQALMHGYSEYYQALVCRSSKKYGEEIARLIHAVDLLKATETRGGGLLKMKPLLSKYEKELAAAKKDNDLIYSDVIPSVSSLKSPEGAIIAKVIEFKGPLCEDFSDLFEKLVPLAVHNAMVTYENRKVGIVNREVSKLRESTQLMNTVLASLNLPAAVEDLGGDNVPQSLLEKSQKLQAAGGLESIDQLFSELPDLLERNRQILSEATRELDAETAADKEMKERFKEKWSRTPSDQLTAGFRTEGNKYKQILDNAIQADQVVKEKYNNNRNYIAILSQTEKDIAAVLPPASAASALKDSDVVAELRNHLSKVDAIKNEREVLESEIKSASSDIRSKFMSGMTADGSINEESISNTDLDSLFGTLIQQVQESIKRQELLLNNIQDANTRFSNAKQTNVSGQKREETLSKLASAFDVYMELTANLKEGTKFYNDLTQLLVRFQSKVSDFCFARKTEKEELLKDLTTSLASQSSAPPPEAPKHHQNKGH